MTYFSRFPLMAYRIKEGDPLKLMPQIIKRVKLRQNIKNGLLIFDKYNVKEGENPEDIATKLYGDPTLDYVVILVSGITNITHEWPMQDYQVYDFALSKYGSEVEMNANHHFETFEIRDNNNRLILPPELIVDADFKIDGSRTKYNTEYTLISQAGNNKLDDKDEYTVATDNIARAVTNLEYEYTENEKRREIDVLNPAYLQLFINDFRDVIKYDKSSNYITSSLASTENTETVNP